MTEKEGLSLLEHMVREQLGLPVSNLVVDQIVEIHKDIPTNVSNLNPSYAQYLSGRFLKGMDLCADLYAIAVACELKKETLKKKEHGSALLKRAKEHGAKTAKDKEAYANLDESYLEAADEFADAKSFRLLVEMRRKDFEKAHYLMRKVSEDDLGIEDPLPTQDAEENWERVREEKTKSNRRSWGS